MIDINVKRNTDDADLREKMERVKDFRPMLSGDIENYFRR